MKTQAIVVAAGKGLRLKSKTSKALVEISRIPIIILTLKAISQSNLLSSIIVVCRRQDIARINKLVSKFKIAKIKLIVAG